MYCRVKKEVKHSVVNNDQLVKDMPVNVADGIVHMYSQQRYMIFLLLYMGISSSFQNFQHIFT
jgi:hypothetical protein